MDISEASEASFIGEDALDSSGYSVSGVGDVNGDGYDDILIGAYWNDDGGPYAGQTYLILGTASGWAMDTNLSNVDASFIGEDGGDHSGYSVSGAGDVNGDGYDDILIGAWGNDDGGSKAGQTYLILGKQSGWAMDTDLSNADASFIGEDGGDHSGYSVSGAGDVNGDGYDDIIIGAYRDDDGGSYAGQTYLILGKASGWAMDTDLSNADASFIGEDAYVFSGCSVSGAGDVNGDGYDDILIGAYEDDDGGEKAGQTYLILGKTSGWAMDVNLSYANASFIGEDADDQSGCSVSGAGDVNCDGYDDILIGANQNADGGIQAGQTYLILGKSSGWSMDMDLSNVDASFIGEDFGDRSGYSVSGAGDVNCDGYDDLLIGANYDGDGGLHAGQTYMILGKPSGWSMDTDLSNADASFIGEDADDRSGCSVSSAGDVNGDGYDDILIGAMGDDDEDYDEGQTYLVTGSVNIEPKEVYTFDIYTDLFSNPGRIFDIGDIIYLELTGLDGDPTCKDAAVVNISFQNHLIGMKRVGLLETGLNTGVYQGQFMVPSFSSYFDVFNFEPRADPSFEIDIVIDYPFRPISVSSVSIYADEDLTTTADKLDFGDKAYFAVTGEDANVLLEDNAFVNLSSDKNGSFTPMITCRETGINTGLYVGSFMIPESMVWFENITVISVRDPTKSDMFKVHTPVQIRPFEDHNEAFEDVEFREKYWNFGWLEEPIWTLRADRDWIQFDTVTLDLFGTPDNGDVGITNIELNISDGAGHYDDHKFNIIVENLDTILFGENVLTATQDILYYMDYNCDDEGQGNTTYHLWTSALWLTMDEATGELSGTPTNDDVGRTLVGVSVHDGNGGVDNTDFNLTVIDVNDQCYIDTENIVTVYQNEPYRRTYTAIDIDSADSFTWTLVTDAEWLSMDQDTGILEGTPTNDDVGTYTVNITVMDSGGLTDSTEFLLEVLNVNDRPEWVDVPDDMMITHGDFFQYNTSATDIDNGTALSYSIRSDPPSEITIDSVTGGIEWHATIHIFEFDNTDLEVTVSAFDGELYANHTFIIEVRPSIAPSAKLISPAKGEKVSSTMVTLVWEGSDVEGDDLTYTIYLSKEEPLVSSLQDDVKIKTDLNRTSFTSGILDVGGTYYWTVIPNDECSDGRCSNDVFSFEVNAPPEVSDIDPQKASSGSKFSFYVRATDDDDTTHTFSLVEAPEGMTIDDLGKIEWTPKDNQVGEHIVIVNVSDGVDYELVSFKLTVEKGEKEESSPLPIILVIAVILIIAGFIIFFVMKKKKEDEEEIASESEVELTKEEIYEAMYGKTAPKEEEGMTTEELKGFIHEQIEELEEEKGEE